MSLHREMLLTKAEAQQSADATAAAPAAAARHGGGPKTTHGGFFDASAAAAIGAGATDHLGLVDGPAGVEVFARDVVGGAATAADRVLDAKAVLDFLAVDRPPPPVL